MRFYYGFYYDFSKFLLRNARVTRGLTGRYPLLTVIVTWKSSANLLSIRKFSVDMELSMGTPCYHGPSGLLGTPSDC